MKMRFQCLEMSIPGQILCRRLPSAALPEFPRIPSPENPGEQVTFNVADVAATDADGDSLSYVLNFGDGTPSGTYTATVSVSDGHGNSVSQSIQIVVSDIPPGAP
jgi:hypothetical protein